MRADFMLFQRVDNVFASGIPQPLGDLADHCKVTGNAFLGADFRQPFRGGLAFVTGEVFGVEKEHDVGNAHVLSSCYGDERIG